MNLLEFIKMYEDFEEITVNDKDYDVEVYFYSQENDEDEWNKAMYELASKLEVIEYNKKDCYAEVNLCDVIEENLENFKNANLFKSYEIEEILDDVPEIFAGGVSEKWFVKFVNAIE